MVVTSWISIKFKVDLFFIFIILLLAIIIPRYSLTLFLLIIRNLFPSTFLINFRIFFLHLRTYHFSGRFTFRDSNFLSLLLFEIPEDSRFRNIIRFEIQPKLIQNQPIETNGQLSPNQNQIILGLQKLHQLINGLFEEMLRKIKLSRNMYDHLIFWYIQIYGSLLFNM